MTGAHTHATEAQLIELALTDGSVDCAECRKRMLEVRGFLDDCREGLLVEPGAAAEREPAPAFIAEVLARTTREDLGWAGDLRLVGRFVGARLRSSRALRFAAASLLVHLLVLPVFAWMALREARQEHVLQISVRAPREQTLPVVPMEPELELEAPGPGPEPELVEADLDGESEPGLSGPEVARIVQRDRAFLRSGSAPQPIQRAAGTRAPSNIARLLDARGVLHHGGTTAVTVPLPDAAPGLEQALLAELLLDTWVFEGRPSPSLSSVLRELGADSERPAAERRLELFALGRARSYGLLDPDGLERHADLERALGSSTPPAGSTLWGAWAEALDECLAERSRADREAAGAWVRWQR